MNNTQLEIIHRALKNLPYQYIGLIPFSREITCDEPVTGTDYIPYGSTLLTTIGLEYQWKGLYFDLATFNYRESIKNRNDMLNNGLIITVADAISLLKKQPGEDIFIRPSLDLKHFSGQVIESSECAKWLESAMLCDSSGSYRMDKDMEVVISEPLKIYAEWRWFIVDSKIVDGSMYRCHNQLIKKHEDDVSVINEAQGFADQWLPNKNCVMDLALTDRGLKVIEFNCLNSSGFYNHDIDKIFRALYNNAVTN